MVICLECNREFESFITLGSHIGQSHREINVKDYYDKYLKKDPLEGICKICGKETKFVYLTIGYNNCCSRKCGSKLKDISKINNEKIKCPFCDRFFKGKIALSSHLSNNKSIHKEEYKKLKIEQNNNKIIKCKICVNVFKDLRSLGSHIGLYHKEINVKDYYDKYLKKDPLEGICKICGKETRFANLKSGYFNHCSTKCSKLNPEVELKTQKTCLEKFGVTNWGKTEENKIKTKEWMLNGGASYITSFIKNPSKPQVALFNLTRELYPSAILNFPVKKFNRVIDIVIPEHNIAIEYDCSYWHQNIEYDKKRQNDLESLGWKFIRFLDYLPSKNELEQKIINIKIS